MSTPLSSVQRKCIETVILAVMLRALFLFLFLHPVPLQCKRILLSNASGLVQNEESQSHAEILNTSLLGFDNFTLCARYLKSQSSGLISQFKHSDRFLTFNFLVSSETTRYLNQNIFSYLELPLLGNHTFNLQ